MRKLDEDEQIFCVLLTLILTVLILGTMVISCERHRIDMNAKVKQETEAVVP